MIPRADIIAWRKHAPWPQNEQVEQDLLISRTLIAIFSDDFLRENLAFRGGTALHKLYLSPQARYSEDIDLVQIKNGPIGPILDQLRKKLKFLGRPAFNSGLHNNTFYFRFDSEIAPVVRMRLKVEINCREHFTVFGYIHFPYKIETNWFEGKCKITTYALNELLGSKTRALYQRNKGRDLFDLWYASSHATFDPEIVLKAFKQFMQSSKVTISATAFIQNLELKIKDNSFIGDTAGLLRPDIPYNPNKALDWFKKELIIKF